MSKTKKAKLIGTDAIPGEAIKAWASANNATIKFLDLDKNGNLSGVSFVEPEARDAFWSWLGTQGEILSA